ncbi:MAG: LysR family transcriptional regulator [Archangium sp.]
MSKPHESQLDLEGLRWVVSAAEAGSLSLAARRENAQQSTVSRAVAKLETSLRVRVFERGARGFVLTDAGERVVAHAREVLERVTALSRAATESRESLRGVVRLNLCTSVGQHLLWPAIVRWAEGREGVHLDARFEEKDVDVLTSSFDLVVRMGRPKDSDAHATPLGTYGHVLVASPRWLKKHGRPKQPSDLERLPALCIRLERVWTSWVFLRDGQRTNVSVTPHVVTTSAESLVSAAVEGAGVAVLPDYLARAALKTRVLVPLLTEWELPRVPVFAFHAPPKRLSRLVREVLGSLRDFGPSPRG